MVKKPYPFGASCTYFAHTRECPRACTSYATEYQTFDLLIFRVLLLLLLRSTQVILLVIWRADNTNCHTFLAMFSQFTALPTGQRSETCTKTYSADNRSKKIFKKDALFGEEKKTNSERENRKTSSIYSSSSSA